MKKSILIVLVVLLLLLTACQPAQESNTDPAGSTPPSSNVTPPSSSAVPDTSTPATSIPATSAPVTTPPITPSSSTGYAHIHYENSSIHWKEYDFSNCVVGYLYWMDKETHTVTLLLAEQTVDCEADGAYIYYVKEVEPTKIYRLLIADPSQQELVHETTHGAVDAMIIYYTMENYLQYVASGQKFIIFDLNTCEETVLMEQYYLDSAYIQKEKDGAMSDYILFTGQPTEDSPYTDYSYNRITGEVAIEDYGDCDCDECV